MYFTDDMVSEAGRFHLKKNFNDYLPNREVSAGVDGEMMKILNLIAGLS